jgi:glycosyltransferase involved in cell wall biosynthesis
MNKELDSYVGDIGLSISVVNIPIERKIYILNDLRALFKIIKIMRKERFDIVVSISPKAGLLAMSGALIARTAKRVHIFQGEIWTVKRFFSRFILKALDKLTALFATDILAVSESEKQFLIKEKVTRLKKIQVLGNGTICGVDVDRFRPNSLMRKQIRSELGISETASVCIFVGRLTKDKGILDLVAAYACIAKEEVNLWLLVVGPDEESIIESALDLLNPTLRARTRLIGFTRHPENYMAASDFLCLPSYREGFGMTVLEAASTQIPSIGSRIYGITDAIVENQTGILFEPGDVSGLSQAMSQLLSNPEYTKLMGCRARHRVSRDFASESVVERYVLFLRQLLDISRYR